jgi:hypothetical protein
MGLDCRRRDLQSKWRTLHWTSHGQARLLPRLRWAKDGQLMDRRILRLNSSTALVVALSGVAHGEPPVSGPTVPEPDIAQLLQQEEERRRQLERIRETIILTAPPRIELPPATLPSRRSGKRAQRWQGKTWRQK